MSAATTTTDAYRRHVVPGAPVVSHIPATRRSWAGAFATHAGIPTSASTLLVNSSVMATNKVDHRPTRRGAPPH